MSRAGEERAEGDAGQTGPPLRGRWILTTRAEGEEDPLVDRLEEAGASVRHVALTRTTVPSDSGPLREAAQGLSRYDWVCFTSARGVLALATVLAELVPGVGPPWPYARASADPGPQQRRPLWGCVGPATALALLEHFGVQADLVPPTWNARALADAILEREPVSSRLRILFLAAESARPDLPQRLGEAGASVTQVSAYRTEANPPSFERLLPPAGRKGWDVIVFTSGLSVRVFFATLEGALGRESAHAMLVSGRPAVIGRSATAALHEIGIDPAIAAARPATEDLTAAILAELTRDPPGS